MKMARPESPLNRTYHTSRFHMRAVVWLILTGLVLAFGCAGVPISGPPGSRVTRAEKTINQWGMTFVYIPEGTFIMGSPPEEPGHYYDEQRHRVTISKGFFMQTTEVTQGQWEGVMKSRPSFFKTCGSECPVEMVSWNEAQEFIRRLNQLESTDSYRLPTEAEWEYACRAGSETPVYDLPVRVAGLEPVAILDQIAWFGDNSFVDYSGGQTCFNWFLEPDRTTKCGTNPVAQRLPNAWGLYDMIGNVWEWCQDWYGEYPSKQLTDPKGSRSSEAKVFRGCGWDSAWNYCRAANRDGFSPGGRGFAVGFRLAKSR